MQVKKFICIKKYSDDFIVGKCYNCIAIIQRYYIINNKWFNGNKNNDFVPQLDEYFISESKYRKNKLINLNNLNI